jgi:release factor glutamine methyltransferase
LKLAETWTVLKVLQWTAGYFKKKGIGEWRRDGELLLAEVLSMDRVGLYLNYDRPLIPRELAIFRKKVEQRAKREPVQYILGKTEFWSLPFKVNPATLIPRPDTEILVEEALKRASGPCAILDVGTGSGAIAIALAHELHEASVEGVDISPEALSVAIENARLNGVDGRVNFREEDLRNISGGPYDIVVANPPYIPEAELRGLMPEVRDFEPREALYGGEDGLDCYRALVRQGPEILSASGWLLLEVGIGQAQAVQALLKRAGFLEIFSRDDYAGIPRVVGGRKAC